MFESFKKYILSRVVITDAEFERIAAVSTLKRLRKKQYLLQEGDVWRHNAFIVSGLVRLYRVDEKGTEHVVNFAKENWWAGDRESLLSGKPSKFNIDAVEPTEVLLIGKEEFDEICREIPAIATMVHDIIQKSLVATQNRLLVHKDYTAEEKYLDMMAKYPDFILRVPLSMIASYLGITPETLSRIRNQVKK